MAKKTKQKTYPYESRCPACRTPFQVTSAKMVGQTIRCQKCERKFEVVGIAEDGAIPYGVGPISERTDEAAIAQWEQQEREARELREKKEKRRLLILHVIEGIILAIVLSVLGYYIWKGYLKFNEIQEKSAAESAKRFGKKK